MSESRAKKKPKEMKPPFMMLKSTPHNLLHSRTITSPLVPGKLADESQLGQLTSLFADNQQTKRYDAPKPPKKRYLEENYSQNKFSQTVIEHVNMNVGPLNKNLEMPSIHLPEVKKKKTDENLLFPDVNPLLPDVVPKTDCDDQDVRTSWRKKLLCWEKLEDSKPTKEFRRSPPELETKTRVKISDRGRRGNSGSSRKPARLAVVNSPEDMSASGSPKPGRRGRARACKGQKYREFMWTNVIHQRRKSSRWELCQDTIENSANSDEESSVGNKTDSLSHSPPDVMSRSSATGSQVNSINNYFKKKKVTRKRLDHSTVKKNDTTKPRAKTNESPRKRQVKRDLTHLDSSLDTSSDKLLTVTGSKKRKLRRQSIRRLQPGTSFKDTRVVEDSGLDTLASIAATKMKLRSGHES